MKIDSVAFGTVEIMQDKVFTMPSGILGFPNSKHYVVIEREELYPFYWLQSIDEPSLAFVIMNPLLFKSDYSLNLAPVLEIMAWGEDIEDVKVYAILNAADASPENITANLQAPVIINTEKKEAVQMVIHDSPYSHQYSVFKGSE